MMLQIFLWIVNFNHLSGYRYKLNNSHSLSSNTSADSDSFNRKSPKEDKYLFSKGIKRSTAFHTAELLEKQVCIYICVWQIYSDFFLVEYWWLWGRWKHEQIPKLNWIWTLPSKYQPNLFWRKRNSFSAFTEKPGLSGSWPARATGENTGQETI